MGSMADRRPATVTNLDRYGNPALEWSRVHDALRDGDLAKDTAQFLGTSSRDGVPHSVGIGGAWLDGDLYFTSSPNARKARHVAANPNCTFSVRFRGIDVVFEGQARRVTDRPTLEKLRDIYNAGGWPAMIQGDAFTGPFSAPSAGPPPWNLYRLHFHTVFGVAGEPPHGATKWTFVG
jgi:hypothetical protein